MDVAVCVTIVRVVCVGKGDPCSTMKELVSSLWNPCAIAALVPQSPGPKVADHAPSKLGPS